MNRQLLISIISVFLTVFAFGQSDSILISNFSKLKINPSEDNIHLYTEAMQWGLVGMTNRFVTDETEILVEEWLEYLYYNDCKRIKAYIENLSVSEKNISSEEREILINVQIDTSLLPIKEFLISNSQSYIFSKCKKCSLISAAGLHGLILLPVDSDSLNNKQSLKRLKYFLETPISGISYEQAIEFCKWRTQVDSLIIVYQLQRDDRSVELPKSKLWDENTQMRCFKYYLPTPEQFDAMNFSFDSISHKQKFFSSFNYKNSKYSKCHSLSETDLRCGHMPINGFSFFHPTSWPKGYWVLNTQGNVAEMTSIKGIARGGSYYHLAKESYPRINNYYSKPELWLGFRCIGIKYELFKY